MTPFRETEEFKRGRTGEHRVAELLQARGWHIIPSYDFSGEDGNKAPRLLGSRQSFVLPDLDASRDGTRVWIEVKTKAAPVVYRIKGNELRHGIEAHLFWSYRQCQTITGCRAFLVIFEEDSGEFLCASIDRLALSAEQGGGGSFRKRMVFWPRALFTPIGREPTRAAA